MTEISVYNRSDKSIQSNTNDNVKVKNGNGLSEKTETGSKLPKTKLDSRNAIAYKLFAGFGFSMAAIGMVLASLPIFAIGVATGILFAILSAKADKIEFNKTIEEAYHHNENK